MSVRPLGGNVAFYILIDKVSETEREAFYRFYDTGYPDEIGELRLDKTTETIEPPRVLRRLFSLRG